MKRQREIKGGTKTFLKKRKRGQFFDRSKKEGQKGRIN